MCSYSLSCIYIAVHQLCTSVLSFKKAIQLIANAIIEFFFINIKREQIHAHHAVQVQS